MQGRRSIPDGSPSSQALYTDRRLVLIDRAAVDIRTLSKMLPKISDRRRTAARRRKGRSLGDCSLGGSKWFDVTA